MSYSKPLLTLIRADLKRKELVIRSDGHAVSKIQLLLSDGISAMLIYRLMSWFGQFSLGKPFALVLHKLNILLNHCVIGVNAKFGEGFVLMHPVGVVVNGATSGGENVVLESGVVIGSVRGDSPTLGSNIYLGAGAKVIGSIHVADNVKVGANAVVVKSCVEGDTLVGIPARGRAS